MKQILIKLITIILFLILTTNCGYHLDRSINNFNIAKIDIEGERKNASKLRQLLIEKNNSELVNTLSMKIDLETIQTSKNKAKTGKILSYNVNVYADVEFIFADEKIKKRFDAASSYDLGSNHSTSIYNEKKTKEMLLRKIVDDIESYLSYKFKNVS